MRWVQSNIRNNTETKYVFATSIIKKEHENSCCRFPDIVVDAHCDEKFFTLNYQRCFVHLEERSACVTGRSRI